VNWLGIHIMNVEEEIRIFLSKLCKDLGICDPLYNLDAFLSKDCHEVNEFARQVFIVEGLDPDQDLKLFRQVKKVTDHWK
jgi:hypothetical protein